jgi:hypothetical protein
VTLKPASHTPRHRIDSRLVAMNLALGNSYDLPWMSILTSEGLVCFPIYISPLSIAGALISGIRKSASAFYMSTYNILLMAIYMYSNLYLLVKEARSPSYTFLRSSPFRFRHE